MSIFLWFIALGVSLAVLVKASDYFTDYSERLGLKLGLSAFIIGATIMSVGTSMPEFVTALVATLNPDPELKVFAIDDILGSNIANALLLIGIASIVAKGGKGLNLKRALIDVDLPFLITTSGLFVVFAMDGNIGMGEGILFLVSFVFFLLYTATQQKKLEYAQVDASGIAGKKKDKWPKLKLLGLIGISGFFIYLGGRYTVESIINIASLLGWSTSILTILLVALGTSLPEIMVSAVSARKGNHAGAIGTAFGSNIFNILFALGIPSLFATLQVSPRAMSIGLPFLIFSVLAAAFVTMDNRVRLWEGGALIIIYFGFVGKVLGII
ncbi:calcium/sodium antiporter [Candidatus Peregrinibacteria bacterium]|jgi:cation:H+ antiporter|nr:calcium/sodium antiporter [Candidatus Peregrinibacteria bacterium]